MKINERKLKISGLLDSYDKIKGQLYFPTVDILKFIPPTKSALVFVNKSVYLWQNNTYTKVNKSEIKLTDFISLESGTESLSKYKYADYSSLEAIMKTLKKYKLDQYIFFDKPNLSSVEPAQAILTIDLTAFSYEVTESFKGGLSAPHTQPEISSEDYPHIHPLLARLMSDYPRSIEKLLKVLYEIKCNPMETTKFIKIGHVVHSSFLFIFPNNHAEEIGINEVIDKINKKLNPHYISFAELIQKKESICHKFIGSPITGSKNAIWDNFIQFYSQNQLNKAMQSRTILLQEWIVQYKKENDGINPLKILAQHRRSGLLSIFSPQQTESIKLIKQFLIEANSTNQYSALPLFTEDSEAPFSFESLF